MKLISKSLYSVFFAASLASCGIVSTATDAALDAAKTYWDENKEDIINSGAEAAKTYWAENKDEIIAGAKELIDTGLATIIEYTEDKLSEQHRKAVTRLLASGVTLEEVDTDGDGVVSEEELAGYIRSNPISGLMATGGAGVLFYAMWLIKQKGRKEEEVTVTPEAPPSG